MQETLSAYERWTWERCCERILSLKHRLGYDERLWVLGFELLDDGRLVDPFHRLEVFDPAVAKLATAIPSTYSAVPEMYCILSTYSTAREVPLSGERVSFGALDRVRRQALSGEDCAGLLEYAREDFSALQETRVPFFGTKLERGDLAFEVWPLPKVPVSFALWRGDEEVAHGGTVLFDRSATHYLPGLVTELVGLTVWRLRNILHPEVKWGYHDLARRGKEGRRPAKQET